MPAPYFWTVTLPQALALVWNTLGADALAILSRFPPFFVLKTNLPRQPQVLPSQFQYLSIPLILLLLPPQGSLWCTPLAVRLIIFSQPNTVVSKIIELFLFETQSKWWMTPGDSWELHMGQFKDKEQDGGKCGRCWGFRTSDSWSSNHYSHYCSSQSKSNSSLIDGCVARFTAVGYAKFSCWHWFDAWLRSSIDIYMGSVYILLFLSHLTLIFFSPNPKKPDDSRFLTPFTHISGVVLIFL